MKKQTTVPQIEVGILFSPEIHFCLNGLYFSGNSNRPYTGNYTLKKENDEYRLQQNEQVEKIQLPFLLHPQCPSEADFELTDVVIGIHFHWERKENQKFKGSLKLIDETEYLTAINILSLEDYLLSVISSEMKATSSIELLKAHAVVSRSWLLAQKAKSSSLQGHYDSCQETEEEYIRWYDREDHTHFDVCADDHCQRYQGISKAYTPTVQEALQSTYGEVLVYQDEICDARFSKCCGGVTERFENTWEPVNHPYLDKIFDAPTAFVTGDLRTETAARAWILSAPAAFCNTRDANILSEVLNDYDQETRHFFRWEVSYSQEELSALVHRKLGIDFGKIQEILPVERGVSGRLIRVKIRGSRHTRIIGKELVIRKAFSPSHLYSSAFIVEKEADRFVFHGAGWGHGVGLCQIGAAVMGARGYSYREILQHYFKDCELFRLYE